MIIEQLWTANAWRSFNYLIACPQTGEALAVDPTDHQQCLAVAAQHGWSIKQIVNTHEHYDHTSGNDEMIAATGAQLMAHAGARPNIPRMDRGLRAGDVIRVGTSVELHCLDTPGHTMAHICLFAPGENPALISGDTLFNAGAGNCHNGGNPQILYETFVNQLAQLPDVTRLYPGHDYLERNLSFTLDREPDNDDARRLLESARTGRTVTTLGTERLVNVFFRLRSATIIRRLRATRPDISDRSDPREIFLALRAMRDKW